MALKLMKIMLNKLSSAIPLFAYISATRIGHQGWETALHCSYANKRGRRLIIIYSNNVANKSFSCLRCEKITFVNLCWIFNIINNKINLNAFIGIYKFVVFIPKRILKMHFNLNKIVNKCNTVNDREFPERYYLTKSKFIRFSNDLVGHIFDKSFGMFPFLSSSSYKGTLLDYYDMELLSKHSKPLKVNRRREGESVLKELGLSKKDWFVCLHMRESSFLGDSHKEWQNQDIGRYLKAIQYITKLGGYVLRMGDPSMKNIPVMKNVIDYAHSECKSNFADIYLSSKARFAIINNSGFRVLPQLFGVPLLSVNLYPVSPLDIYKESLIIYKKVYSLTLSRELKLKEILSSPSLCYYYTDDEYKNAGIEIRQNSEDEILDAVIEMFKLLNDNKWDELDYDQRLFLSEIKKSLKFGNIYRTAFYPDAFCRIGSKYMRENWE